MAVFDSDNEKLVEQVLRPKDAATLVLVKRDGAEPRILMGQRHGNMAFMANKYVFPGGRLDPGDMRIPVAIRLRPEVEARAAHGATPAKGRGLAPPPVRGAFAE